MDKKIIDKVIKLLELAKGTSFEGEAETAANMAAELMAKYNISIQDTLTVPGAFEEYLDRRLTPAYKYDSDLVTILSYFNGVAFYTQINKRTRRGNFIYAGRPQDIESFRYMLDIVLQQRASALKAWRKPGYNTRPWLNGFTLGVNRKVDRLIRMAEAKTREWGLVVLDPCKEAQKWYEMHNDTKLARESRYRTFSREGLMAGENVSIHKGISKQNEIRSLTA